MSAGLLVQSKPEIDIVPHSQSAAVTHMVQLDAIRGLAALMVLVGHFSTHARGAAPIHQIGVRLFFVLSGFLITGILLRCRDMSELKDRGTWRLMKLFYARRFLRIFPLFLFTLLAAIALNLDHARANAAWLLGSATNILIAVRGTHVGPLSPYWSLAVEEQFYLVWPWVIMLVPRRWLVPVMIATVLVGPLYRTGAVLVQMWQMSTGARHSMNFFAIEAPPFACMDTLAMGALLAWASQKSVDVRWRKLLMRLALWGGLPTMLLMQGLHTFAYSSSYLVRRCFFDASMALLFTWVVGRAATGFSGLAGSILTWRPLLYTGTISYGIYVYHSFLWYIPHEKFNAWLAPRIGGWFSGGADGALAFLNTHFAQSGYGLFLPRVIVTFLLAALSWRILEKPLNDLKRHFEYGHKRRPQSMTEQPDRGLARAAR